MNLFLLSRDPDECAKWHCDKHVVKMILEIVQMLYTTWHLNNPDDPMLGQAPPCRSTGNNGYKKISNHNHPTAIWMRESLENYMFSVRLAAALALEFHWRYGHHHSCTVHVLWLSTHIPAFKKRAVTQIPQCMPEQYKVPNHPVQAYRNYYIGDKARFAKWSKRPEPPWWKVK